VRMTGDDHGERAGTKTVQRLGDVQQHLVFAGWVLAARNTGLTPTAEENAWNAASSTGRGARRP
jgi:hypothetical protein